MEPKDRDSIRIPVQTEAESSTASPPDAEAAGQAAEVASPDPLAGEVKRLQAEVASLRDSLARRQADFENTRKRIERERGEESHRAVARVAEAVLPVLDSFERALAATPTGDAEEYRKGFELIEKQLFEALARFGVEPMETEGQPFDPHVHEAVERVESQDHPEGTVLSELRRGYRLRDKVLRPAMVRVAVHPAEKS